MQQHDVNFVKKEAVACKHPENERGWFFDVNNFPRNKSDTSSLLLHGLVYSDKMERGVTLCPKLPGVTDLVMLPRKKH